jgi:hypothetical protein
MIKPGDVRFSFAFSLGLIAVAVVSGCNSDMPFDVVPVQGKVTYEDGSLIKADSILVTFNPVKSEEHGKLVPPGGQTYLNVQDGTFSAVSSRRANDGVVAGRHKVVVVSFKNRSGGNPVPTDAVPADYRKVSTTPLEIDVDSDTEFIDLKVRNR